MKRLAKLKNLHAKNTKDKETGLSLVETLVAITLFVVVGVIAVSLITTTADSTTRFADVSTTQTKVNQASSIIQRDLSLARSISVADNNIITFTTRQDNKDYQVSIFGYVPAVTDIESIRAIAGVDESKLPSHSAIIQIRQGITDPTDISQTVLVDGYEPSAYQLDGENRGLYAYYDSDNSRLDITTLTTDSARGNIARIEFRIAANVEGRGTPTQIESSVTPSYFLPSGSAANNVSTTPDCPPNFKATIVETERQATITWNTAPGATSYTIYRETTNGTQSAMTEIISNPFVSSYVDTGLQWGHTYRYTIQSNGPGGISVGCSPSVATVVPAQNGFVNVNPAQQNLTAVKANASAENIARPVVANITQAAAPTVNVHAGARYTVARGLTNQLAWNTTFGTTGFNIYKNGSTEPVKTITGTSTLFWQDLADFGNADEYTIKAFNAGGESIASTQVPLYSPPKASQFSASAPDLSVSKTVTDTAFTVTNRSPNTTGFIGYRTSATNAAATVFCDTAVAVPALNSLATTLDPNYKHIRDNNAGWGTTLCYKFVPFNDAGLGIISDNIEVKHKPSKFNFVSSTSTKFGFLDVNRALPAGAQCWVTNRSRTLYPCNENYGLSTNNRYAVGLFVAEGSRDILAQRTDITVAWSEAVNAYGGYTVEKVRTSTGGTVNQGSPASTNSASYVKAAQSSIFKNEMPGSEYDFDVTATALNGETRTTKSTPSAKLSVLTSPEIPVYMGNLYQIRGYQQDSRRYQRVEVYVGTGVNHGRASTVTVNTWVEDWYVGRSRASVAFPANSGHYVTPSNGYEGGLNYRETLTTVNGTAGKTSYSSAVGRTGRISLYCTQYCPYDYYSAPERYPNYASGTHNRYFAAFPSAVNSVDGGPANSIPPAGPPFPPTAPEPDGDIPPDYVTYDCAIIPESDPLFVDEYGCEYGTGIPITPTGFAVQSVTGTDVTFTWAAVPNVTSYTVNVDTNGTVTPYPVPFDPDISADNGTYSLTVTLPVGSSTVASVVSHNAVNSSVKSNEVTVKIPSVPQNLRVKSIVGNIATIEWDAAINGVSYVVTSVIDGETNTYPAVGTSYPLDIVAGKDATVRVQAVNGMATSAYSNTITIQAPAAPANLTLVSQSADGALVKWDAVAGSTSYTVTSVIDGVVTNYSTTALQFDVPIADGKTANITVKAVNAIGSSVPSNALVVGAKPTVPQNLRVVSETGSNVVVGWNNVTSATSYVVSTVIDGVTTSQTVTSASATVAIPYGKTANVTVKAVNASGTSAASANLAVSIAVVAPAAPATFTAITTANPNQVTHTGLSWSAVTCVAGTPQYRVVRTAPSAATIYDWGTALSVAVAHTANTNYNYEVTSRCNSGGVFSVPSLAKALNFTPRYTAPSAPTLAPTTDASSYLIGSLVTFGFPSNTCYAGSTPTYKLYNGTTLVGTFTTPSTNVMVPETVGSYSYTYTVSCTSGSFTTPESAKSPAKVITTTATPAVPANLRVVSFGGTAANVAWNASANATSYEVKWTAENGTGLTKTATTTGTTFRVILPSGLAGDEGLISVRALNGIYASAFTPILTVEVPRGDYNGDSFPDILARYSTATELFNSNGAGGWASAYGISPDLHNFNHVIVDGDWNNDGHLDIAGRHTNGNLYMFPGNGTGEFGAKIYMGGGNVAALNSILEPADFNNDGNLDLIGRSPGSLNGALYLYTGNGDGTINAGQLIGNAWNSIGAFMAPADFNNDGNIDLMTRYTNDTLGFYYGVGDGTIGFGNGSGTGWNVMFMGIDPADYTGDGKVDIIVRDGAGLMWTYPGNGAGSFGARIAHPSQNWAPMDHFLNTKDWNRDGIFDMTVRTNTGVLQTYYGNGAGRFPGGAGIGSGWSPYVIYS